MTTSKVQADWSQVPDKHPEEKKLEPVIREQCGRAGTGHKTWHGAHVLGRLLMGEDPCTRDALLFGDPPPASPKECCVLELGAGTGQLAIDLARDGWRKIIATDGERSVVRGMKHNVYANRLGHAIRCLHWDWAEEPPKALDLANVDLVIGSDLVYYSRSHGPLAKAIRCILRARQPGDPRPPPRVLLLVTMRRVDADGAGQVVHHSDPDCYTGSNVERFVEVELPAEGLFAQDLPVPSSVFQHWEFPGSVEDQLAFRLFAVMARCVDKAKDPAHACAPRPRPEIEAVVSDSASDSSSQGVCWDDLVDPEE